MQQDVHWIICCAVLRTTARYSLFMNTFHHHRESRYYVTVSKPFSLVTSRLANLDLWDVQLLQMQNTVRPKDDCPMILHSVRNHWHKDTVSHARTLESLSRLARQQDRHVFCFAALSMPTAAAGQYYCLQPEQTYLSQYSKFTHSGIQGQNMDTISDTDECHFK
jgi:hypothetical protein